MNNSQKRKRGHFSDAEKGRGKIVRDRTKKKTLESPAERLQMIASSGSQLLLNSEIKSAIQQITVQKVPDSSSSSVSELFTIYNEQFEILTKKIEILEEEIALIRIRLQEFSEISRKWETERNLTKQLIQIHEDLMFQNDQKLLWLDGQYEYQAKRLWPWFLRVLNEFFTGNPDLLITNTRITQNTIQRLTQMEHLVKVNAELAEVSLTILYDQDLLKNMEFAVIDYREIRIAIGKTFRYLREASRKRELADVKKDIIWNFESHTHQINQVGFEFKDVMESTQNSIQTIFSDFATIQQKIVQAKTNDQLNIHQIQFDRKISDLVKNFKIK